MKLQDISLSLAGLPVFDHFSAELITPGANFILGPSGIGKTTLLRMLVGLMKPDSGEMIDTDKSYSVVFQEDRLLPAFDIAHNIDFVTDNPLREDLVDRLSLRPYLGQPIRELSGGTKRRVALLRALNCDYDCLVLDETLNGLDDALKQQVALLIAQETAGKTVIIATHDTQIKTYFTEYHDIYLDGGSK